jgi:hypothetical protein
MQIGALPPLDLGEHIQSALQRAHGFHLAFDQRTLSLFH